MGVGNIAAAVLIQLVVVVYSDLGFVVLMHPASSTLDKPPSLPAHAAGDPTPGHSQVITTGLALDFGSFTARIQRCARAAASKTSRRSRLLPDFNLHIASMLRTWTGNNIPTAYSALVLLSVPAIRVSGSHADSPKINNYSRFRTKSTNQQHNNRNTSPI